jgi:hypothetical protein
MTRQGGRTKETQHDAVVRGRADEGLRRGVAKKRSAFCLPRDGPERACIQTPDGDRS